MVEDDMRYKNVFICCKAFQIPQHKSGPCRTFVSKYRVSSRAQDNKANAIINYFSESTNVISGDSQECVNDVPRVGVASIKYRS